MPKLKNLFLSRKLMLINPKLPGKVGLVEQGA